MVKRGQIVEQGTHAELMAEGGTYQLLVQMQQTQGGDQGESEEEGEEEAPVVAPGAEVSAGGGVGGGGDWGGEIAMTRRGGGAGVCG